MRTAHNAKPTALKAFQGKPGNRPLSSDTGIALEPIDEKTFHWLSQQAKEQYNTWSESYQPSISSPPLDVVLPTLVAFIHELFMRAIEQRQDLYTEVTNRFGEVS